MRFKVSQDIICNPPSSTLTPNFGGRVFSAPKTALGNITELRAFSVSAGTATKTENLDISVLSTRREQYALLREIKLLLRDIETPKAKKRQVRTMEDNAYHRVVFCGSPLAGYQPQEMGQTARVYHFASATVKYDTVRHKAMMGQVMYCGSVWTCPICSARESRKNAELLVDAVRGGAVGGMLHVTFTVSHQLHDELGELLRGMSERFQNLWRDSSVKRWLADMGFLGRVTVKEVTVSHRHGWHPHYHVLFFFSGGIDPEKCAMFESHLKKTWIRVCGGLGAKGKPLKAYEYEVGMPDYQHGVRVHNVADGDMANLTQYVTKFAKLPQGENFDLEMTSWQRKNSHGSWIDFTSKKGFSPFALAAIHKNPHVSSEKKAWARRRFIEFVQCYFGISQFHFSRGFWVKINQKTPKEKEKEAKEQAKSGNASDSCVRDFLDVEVGLVHWLNRQPQGIPKLLESTEKSILFDDRHILLDFLLYSVRVYSSCFDSFHFSVDDDVKADRWYCLKQYEAFLQGLKTRSDSYQDFFKDVEVDWESKPAEIRRGAYRVLAKLGVWELPKDYSIVDWHPNRKYRIQTLYFGDGRRETKMLKNNKN